MVSLIPYPHVSKIHLVTLWKSTAYSVCIHHDKQLVCMCEDVVERTTVKKNVRIILGLKGLWYLDSLHSNQHDSSGGNSELKITWSILKMSSSFCNLSNFRKAEPLVWEVSGITKNNSTLDFLSPLIETPSFHVDTFGNT